VESHSSQIIHNKFNTSGNQKMKQGDPITEPVAEPVDVPPGSVAIHIIGITGDDLAFIVGTLYVPPGANNTACITQQSF
jgi:hypothetical protein